MDNTRVLALRIDEKLQKGMKEYLAKQRKTVKDYVTELITQDLQKNAIVGITKEEKTVEEIKDGETSKTNQKENVKEKLAEVKEKETNKNKSEKHQKETANVKVIANNETKIHPVKEQEKGATELKVSSNKKQVEKSQEKKNVVDDKKQEQKKTAITEKADSKKIVIKKNQKEDEEEFE